MKEEIYSLGERILIFLVLFVGSLIISLIYLFCRVDFKQTYCFWFIICVIYASCFVFLNVIAMFDLVFNNIEGFEKFFKTITTYYIVFNWIDKVLGLFVINVISLFDYVVSYMESGYYSWYKKLFDFFKRGCDNINKMTKAEKAIKIIIGLLLIVILVITIYYRKHFNLGVNPLDYYNVLLNCYAMFEIYTAVGFFMIQVIMDYRLRRNSKLIERYYRISKIKIIEKTAKYLKKIKDTYEALKKDAPIFEKNNESGYHKYLKEVYNEAKNKAKYYGLVEK